MADIADSSHRQKAFRLVTSRSISRSRIHVVVACTHRKHRYVPATLRLRCIGGTRTVTRRDTWVRHLVNEDGPAISRANELYAGEHWSIARTLPDLAPSRTGLQLWVCSAGYGLIPADAPIRPYAATFSAGQPDTVPGDRRAAAEWWGALGEWSGPVDAPRTFAQLVEHDPGSRYLVAISAPYVQACWGDLLDAGSRVTKRGSFSVISAGTRPGSDLDEYLLPVDARLQGTLGGTLQALNVRAAAHLVERGVTSHEAMSAYLEDFRSRQPELQKFERRPMSDEEIRAFVAENLGEDPSVSHSRLLRELRSSGRASEQSRFARLFRSVQVSAS